MPAPPLPPLPPAPAPERVAAAVAGFLAPLIERLELSGALHVGADAPSLGDALPLFVRGGGGAN